MERIGFIGLGVMGQPMALNPLKAGHGLTVHARGPQRGRPLAEAAARLAASPRALGLGGAEQDASALARVIDRLSGQPSH